MSPVATETPTPGWGLGPTPAYTVIYTGKLHHDRGRYPRHRSNWADRLKSVVDTTSLEMYRPVLPSHHLALSVRVAE